MTETRVIQDPANGNKWQAQYRDPAIFLWFDIGDGQTDKAAADKRAADYRERGSVRSIDLGDDGVVEILIPRAPEPDGEPNVDEVQVVTRGGELSVSVNGDELVHPTAQPSHEPNMIIYGDPVNGYKLIPSGSLAQEIIKEIRTAGLSWNYIPVTSPQVALYELKRRNER